MGCCVSTGNTSPPSKAPQTTTSKSPPPSHPMLEEETVKEVLSETETPTIPKPACHSPFIKTAPLLHDFSHKKQRNGAVKAFADDENSEEVSEICSNLSESVSVSTTVTEKRENNDEFHEVRQKSPAKFRNRSFSGEMKREKTVGRSPGRRSEPSPGRVRSGCGYVRRSENGESSGRRSRSPVTRSDFGSSKSALVRTQSARKTGKSPGRIGSGLGDRTRKLEDGKESGDSKWPPTTSLRHPSRQHHI